MKARSSSAERRERGALARWASILTLLACGCVDLVGPGLIDQAEALLPVPSQYARWWSITERCSGLRGDLGSVRWYVLPESRTIPDMDEAVGTYIYAENAIVLARGQQSNGFLVRHEMLHALRGRKGHPRNLFLEQCGGVVSCADACGRDAGDSPVWNLRAEPRPIVRSTLVTELHPPEVSLSSGSRGCVTILVGVRNDHARDVAYDLDRGRALEWNVEGLGGGRGGGRTLTDSLVVVRPGQVWSYAFDCPRMISEDAAPGTYAIWGTVRTGSGRVAGEPIQLRVLP